MKGWLCWLLMAVATGSVAQKPVYRLEGVGALVIPVTINKMTNLVFPGPVRTGVKVSPDILVQKVRGVENVFELKALRQGLAETNMTVYGTDGRVYEFVVRFEEAPAVLTYRVLPLGDAAPVFLSGLPAGEDRLARDAAALALREGFLRVSARSGRVRLSLQGVYLQDSLQWLAFRCTNGSGIGYRPVFLRCFLRDRKRVKRRAEQEVEVSPVFSHLPTIVAGREVFALGFEPFVVPADKRLVVEMTGQDGRTLLLKVRGKVLLRGKRLR